MPLNFGPDVRLRSRREFVAVQQTGRRVSTRYLTMLALPNQFGRDRLGLVASRRIGGAVVRNRAKRRLREVFRLRPASARASDARPGLDLVVIVRTELSNAGPAAVTADFHAALARLSRGLRS